MSSSLPFILISSFVLMIVVLLAYVFRSDQRQNRLSPIAGLAFGFILAGRLSGGNLLPRYGLMAASRLHLVNVIILKPGYGIESCQSCYNK
jgi:hypothetical protein